MSHLFQIFGTKYAYLLCLDPARNAKLSNQDLMKRCEFTEGASEQVLINRVERNQRARELVSTRGSGRVTQSKCVH